MNIYLSIGCEKEWILYFSVIVKKGLSAEQDVFEMAYNPP